MSRLPCHNITYVACKHFGAAHWSAQPELRCFVETQIFRNTHRSFTAVENVPVGLGSIGRGYCSFRSPLPVLGAGIAHSCYGVFAHPVGVDADKCSNTPVTVASCIHFELVVPACGKSEKLRKNSSARPEQLHRGRCFKPVSAVGVIGFTLGH